MLEQRRTRAIHLKLTESQYQRYIAAAQAEEMGLGELVRLVMSRFLRSTATASQTDRPAVP